MLMWLGSGYELLQSWREAKFSAKSPLAEKLASIMNEQAGVSAEKTKAALAKKTGAYALSAPDVKDWPRPGPFFVYTSNVDNHFIRAGFAEHEVYEIHGECFFSVVFNEL